jgi:alpha/beta superfamily hydrolase
METKLVVHTARRLAEAGFQTLRFNFRGVGQSAGTWDGGAGERADVEAAIRFVLSGSPRAWLAVFGFSFGAWVGLDAGERHLQVRALVGVVPPVRMLPPGFLAGSAKPKLIVGAGRDAVVDPERLAAWARALPPPAEFIRFDDADHLFGGRTEDVADTVARFLEAHAPSPDAADGAETGRPR